VECANCGTINAPGVEICVGCGRLLSAGAAGPGYDPPPGPGAYPPPPPGPADPYPPAGGPGAYGPPGPGGYPPPGSGGYPPPDPGGPGGYPPPDPGGPGGYPPPDPGGPGGYPPPGPGGYPPPGGPAGYPPPPPVPGGYGPPGGPGSYGPTGDGQPPRGKRRGLLVVLALLVVAGVAAAAFVVLANQGDEPEEVVLEPVGMAQADDFSGNLDVGDAAGAAVAVSTVPAEIPDPRTEEVGTTLAGRHVQGGEPAVYGGSRDTQVCDVAQLVAFLSDPANSAKAEAWAGVLDVEVSGIPDYVAGLTAVRLRFDTRVTNHGFRDGEATAFQSLLQAGTGVLVDDTGVPRVKCNCGNPLSTPAPLDGTSSSDALDLDGIAQNPDDAWDGLDPAQAVTVGAAPTPVAEVTLVDLDGGGLIERPVGSDGASLKDVGTGDVQVTLEWASDADLDLHVVEPDGTEIWYEEPGPSSTGGALDVDSNVECVNDGGVENVYWPASGAPTGTYTVRVEGFRLSLDDGTPCGGGEFTLTITIAGEERVEQGTVDQDGVAEFEFVV
jgi:hypothetical protein